MPQNLGFGKQNAIVIQVSATLSSLAQNAFQSLIKYPTVDPVALHGEEALDPNPET